MIKPAENPDKPRRLPPVSDAIYNPNEKLNGKSKKMPLKVYLFIYFSPPLLYPVLFDKAGHTFSEQMPDSRSMPKKGAPVQVYKRRQNSLVTGDGSSSKVLKESFTVL